MRESESSVQFPSSGGGMKKILAGDRFDEILGQILFQVRRSFGYRDL